MSGGTGIDEAVTIAKQNGFQIVWGDNYHLTLDLDTHEQLMQYENLRGMASSSFGAMEIERWRSKSNHWHVLVYVGKPLEAARRIALEAALGSDPKRTILCIKDLVNNPDKEPCVLFKPKYRGEAQAACR